VNWLAAFVWTLALEYPVYQWALGTRTRLWWHPAACTLALNLLTHPLFSLWLLHTPRSPAELLVAELGIVAVEALALRCLPWSGLRGRLGLAHAAAAALGANGISFAVGRLWLAALGS
jgi:hypothetical protein